MTDWVNWTETSGRLTRLSPSSTWSTIQPVQASTAKKPKTQISAMITKAMRHLIGTAMIRPSNPMWARLRAARQAP